MSSYGIQIDDDGSGNFDAVVANAPTTKFAGGTRLTIPWLQNANAGTTPNNLVVTAATNATPIAITTASAHNLVTGDVVTITGGLVNTAVNGTFTFTNTGSTTGTLDNSVGNGTYTASSAVLKKLFKPKEVATAVQAALRAILDDRASGN